MVQHNTTSVKKTRNPSKILIIDDEISICIAVQGLLEMYNYDAEYALNPEEGLSFLKENPDTDVVILDINFGREINGIELLKMIKTQFKYVQVIMFTSINSLDTGVACMKKGAIDYITKPYKEEDFLKKIPAAIVKKRVEQMNDLYLGILVHDLKNPLQSIMGAIEFIRLTFRSNLSDQDKKIIALADKGINQIRMTINNILGIAKFEQGAVCINKEEFNVKAAVAEALETFESDMVAQPDKISVASTFNDPFTIKNDRDFFSRVLINIVSNALRFTPLEEKISIALITGNDDFIEVAVTNPGSYIEESERNKIFDKFSRVDPVIDKTKSGNQNFGLGLTFCKMAVDIMGGSIWVEGNRELQETTFHFTIKNFKGT